MTDERWADIPGHPGYQASSLGRVRSIKKNPARVIAAYLQNGYLRVRLYSPATDRGRHFRVHRLILMAFRGPPAEGQGVGRHLNGNPLDNHLDNLAWGTLGDNAQDAIRHGRASCIRRGERHPGAKLTDAQFAEVGRLARAGVKRKLLAERFGITPNYAWMIGSGRGRTTTGHKERTPGRPAGPTAALVDRANRPDVVVVTDASNGHVGIAV